MKTLTEVLTAHVVEFVDMDAYHRAFAVCRCGAKPTEDAHPKHVAEAVTAAGLAVIQLPVVAHKGPNDTDASAFRDAADRLDGGYSPGGSNTKRAISQLLRAAADAAEAVSS